MLVASAQKIIHFVYCATREGGVKLNLNREGKDAQQIHPAGLPKVARLLLTQKPRHFWQPADEGVRAK